MISLAHFSLVFGSMPSFPKLLPRLLLLVGLIASCNDASKEPFSFGDPDKADSLTGQFSSHGEIRYGGEVLGDFVDDNQFDSYSFSALAGAQITLDNAHRGTAARLDSVMALYGPSTPSGAMGPLVAEDDDGGYGLHARIKNFTIPSEGEYLAVLGTYLGLDRGHYRLTLECLSEKCQPKLGPIAVSAKTVETSEDGSSQVFEIQLTERPTSEVQIWIDNDNFDEALVYPTRVFFCPEGTALDNVGCSDDPEDVALGGGEWQRTVSVRVTGVRDSITDGDRPFELSFRVQSGDTRFDQLALSPILGRNADQAGAEVPTYTDLDGLQDEELLSALYEKINDHQVFGYHGVNSARTLLFGMVGSFDDKVESIYTGVSLATPGDSITAFMAGYNTEHSWPQAQFKKLDPMVSDLHHIYVADTSSNGSRSSFGFGLNSSPDNPNSTLGRSTSDSRSKVYQVRPERRGDIARAHFYMVARYRNDTTIGIDFDDDNRSENGSMEDLEEIVLREWSRLDPVDDRERRRNERVEAAQGNRNPFIDRPDLIERISDF